MQRRSDLRSAVLPAAVAVAVVSALLFGLATALAGRGGPSRGRPLDAAGVVANDRLPDGRFGVDSS